MKATGQTLKKLYIHEMLNDLQVYFTSKGLDIECYFSELGSGLRCEINSTLPFWMRVLKPEVLCITNEYKYTVLQATHSVGRQHPLHFRVPKRFP